MTKAGQKGKKFTSKKGIVRIVIFTVAVAAILVAMLFAGRKPSGIVTAYVKKGTITHKSTSEAVFLKEEVGINSSFEGKFVPNTDEGAKVAKGEVIAYIVADGMEDVFAQLKAAERKLNAAQTAAYAYTNVYPDGYQLAESEIRDVNAKLASDAQHGNISDYPELIAQMNELFKDRNTADDPNRDDAYIKNLTKEINELNEKLSGYTHKIEAPCAGIVSFFTDGTAAGTTDFYKELATCEQEEKFDGITFDKYKNVRSTETYAGKKVTSGTFVARIMPDIYCYVVAKTDIGSQGRFEFASKDLGISGKGKVVYFDKNVLVMKCATGNETFCAYNKADLDIYISSESGMKVPITSLTDWDDPKLNARLTVVKSSIVKYIYVEVLAYDNEYAIIAPHSVFDSSGPNVVLNDTYVVNYESVTEGEVV